MALFPKKVTQIAQVADVAPVIADLTTDLSGLVSSLQGQVADLQTQVTAYQNLEKLSASAEKLGFQGNVSNLFAENKMDYTSTLEAMISGKMDAVSTNVVKANTESYLRASNKPAGSGSEDEVIPTTRGEAVHLCKNDGMTLKAATVQARTIYPNLFK